MEHENDLISRCRRKLSERWGLVTGGNLQIASIPSESAAAIERSVNSTIKTCRYVLPTQLLAKCATPSLDCRSVQAGCGLKESFDARSVNQDVLVPFDRDNHNVLGGSTEPYANNPLRIPAITPAHRAAQKDKSGYDDLMLVLDYAQQHPEAVEPLFDHVLMSVARRLDQALIVYPVPNRVSLSQTIAVLSQFLKSKSGGLRLQAVTVALLKTLGGRFAMFESVSSSKTNAADASTGGVADLECLDSKGNIVLAVEVKDRQLTLRHVQDKLPAVRKKGVKELLFLVRGGATSGDAGSIDKLTQKEFITGQNVYVCEIDEFLQNCLVLLGETGRREYLAEIGAQLDEVKADIEHRTIWRDLPGSL